MASPQRHKIVRDYRTYPHTRVTIDLEEKIAWALKNRAFLEGVPYKRYQKRNGPTR